MKKLLLTICILLFLTISGISQNILDSLITVLEDEKPEGKERVDLLLKICYKVNVNYRQYQAQSTIYGKEAIKISENLNDQSSLAVAYFELGDMYGGINYDTSILYLKKARVLFKNLDEQSKLIQSIDALARAYQYRGNYDSALVLYKTSYEYYKKENNIQQQITLLQDIGVIHCYSGDYSKALDCFKESLATAEKSGNLKWQSRPLSNIGYVYFNLASIDKTLEYFLRSLKISEELNDSISLTTNYTNIGAIYAQKGDHKTALEYTKKALSIAQKKNSNFNIVNILVNAGELHYEMKDFEEAENYANQALKLARELGYSEGIANGLKLLGRTVSDQQQYDKALKYLVDAEVIYNEMQHHSRQSIIFIEIGKIYSLRSDYVKALKYYRKSLANALASGELLYICASDSSLSRTFESLGNIDSALFYQKLYSIHQDSLVNTEKEAKIANLQIEYETEKKEQQIGLLEKDNQVQELKIQQSRIFNWGLGGLVLIILLMALLFIRQNKLKNEHKTVLLEQKLLRLQMNPHFIFNALSNILNFIDMKENEKASGYLTTFSKLLRTTLESTRQDLVPFEKEASSLKNYLELQKLRHKDKFDYHIEIDENIEGEDMLIPPMLVQPFIENAIEHGIRHKKTIGRIDVRFFLKDKKILCEVEDDGVGRAKAWEAEVGERSGHKSLATEIIKDRIKTLNKKFRQKIQLQIIDITSENAEALGTKVLIDLPYRSAFE